MATWETVRRLALALPETAESVTYGWMAWKVKGKLFRIGHIGHFNDLMLMGTLSGVEMGLDLAKAPHRSGGVLAAMEVLKRRDVVPMTKAAVA